MFKAFLATIGRRWLLLLCIIMLLVIVTCFFAPKVALYFGLWEATLPPALNDALITMTLDRSDFKNEIQLCKRFKKKTDKAYIEARNTYNAFADKVNTTLDLITLEIQSANLRKGSILESTVNTLHTDALALLPHLRKTCGFEQAHFEVGWSYFYRLINHADQHWTLWLTEKAKRMHKTLRMLTYMKWLHWDAIL